MMSESSRPRASRTPRRFVRVLGVVFVCLLALWLHIRHADRRAWPAGRPGVRLEPRPRPGVADDSGARNAWDALLRLAADADGIPTYGDAWLADLRRFDREGFTDPRSRYPELDQWLSDQDAAFELWSAAASAGFAEPPEDGRTTLMPVLFRVVELSRLSAYRAALARRDGDWDACIARWRETLRIAAHVTEGQAAIGLFVALNATVSVTRDILLAATEDRPPADVVRITLALLRDAEAAVTPLAEAVRHDRRIAHQALAVLHDPGTPGAEVAPRRRPSRLSLRVARWLGSRPEVSARNLDAVASHAIAAAEQPYDPAGLFAGLPRWCRLQGRSPWSRDPLGALAATVFVRNTIASPATNPNRRAELRAARIALAFHSAREARADGTWPDSLDALLEFGLDPEALLDPFASDGRRWVHHPPDGHWRFHGVGPDQQDHGGAVDWFSSPETPGADLVFSSAERERRAALDDATGLLPAPPPRRTPGP